MEEDEIHQRREELCQYREQLQAEREEVQKRRKNVLRRREELDGNRRGEADLQDESAALRQRAENLKAASQFGKEDADELREQDNVHGLVGREESIERSENMMSVDEHLQGISEDIQGTAESVKRKREKR